MHARSVKKVMVDEMLRVMDHRGGSRVCVCVCVGDRKSVV